MAYIAYEPEFIDSKLDKSKRNFPILIEPHTTLRSLSIDFKLDIIFQAKEVSANFRSSKYFIGLRNAIVEIHADNAKCTYATTDATINVELITESSKSNEHESKSKLEMKLSKSTSLLKAGQEINFGEIEGKKTMSKFSKVEKQLSSKLLGNRVEWHYALPDTNSIFSDLLDEVLTLDANFQWNFGPMKGTIYLKPGQVEVFDSERKRFPKFKGLAMIKVLIHKQILVHKKNIQITYQVY